MVWISENTARQVRAFLEQIGLAAFGRWWSGELRALAPPWLRDFLYSVRAQLALDMRAEDLILFAREEGCWRELTRWARSDPAGQELPSEVVSALGGRERAVLVILPPGDSLRRQAEVPAALAENLQASIGFELDRYTPYKPDQVYFDVVVRARDDSQRRLTIEIGIVPRERADQILDRVQGMGLSPVGLLCELPDEAAAALDFLPAERRPRVGTASRWTYGLPLATLGFLALLALVLPIWQKRATVRALEPLVREARGRAEAAESLHRQLIARQDEYNVLLAKKHAQPMAIEVLDEATRILPDDTWVHTFELKSDLKNPAKNFDLQVRGETGISGKLIAVFEESRLFTQTTYKSPVTKGPPGAGDVYHVGAEVKKRPLPDFGASAATSSAAPSLSVSASTSGNPPMIDASSPAAVSIPGTVSTPAPAAPKPMKTPSSAELIALPPRAAP